MSQALALAEQAMFITSPNPRVGCVITSPAGQVLGQGHTQAAGQGHAEVMALREAQAAGLSLRGATAYVSLEPCSHHGRTGPCCDALSSAGIARVVASIQDPNPQVAGQGLAKLRAAGVQVEVGLLSEQSQELNQGFFKRMQHGTPWLRMKSAQSLDGQTALCNGQSQWITGEAARLDGHQWRARACAILTGIGTVLADNPLLNVRGVSTPRQPHLLLLDSNLQTPLHARLWEVSRPVVIYHAQRHPDREAALQSKGAELAYLPGLGGKVDLAAMCQDMGSRAYNEVHVEAGHKLNGSLLKAGLIDELLVYLAPTLLGPGQSMAALPALSSLDQQLAWTFIHHTRLGPDLRLLARPLR
ncbi:MAG: bifunctional diaminohydroxyphosphoribosylaminopyrimidine deaminase/5-amino-6-(5-phosphoribosylamino)uracil reductase RibD [Betaproteobacteria bacterium]|nr:bifunctional diaminohydroxyphosphoribosylaminopyrimidine deaminase/5-amino-6-(5-phosphoribosylamino)uracil reductase RibD [Betaproteobacteria bacterium]